MFGFLRDLVPAPVIDIFLPMLAVVIVGTIAYRKITAKAQEHNVWDKIVEKVGGEKLQVFLFEREIHRLQKSGDIAGAARLYEDAEWWPEAINLYVEAGECLSAAVLYEQLEQWESASEMYFQADDWRQGANMLAQAGKQEEAADHFAEHGEKIDAAKLYYDSENYAKAAALYIDVSYFPQAAQCFEKLGDFIKAAENYEEQWVSTSSVGGGGLISQAGNRGGKIAFRAGQLYEQGGAPDRAAELYKRAGLGKQAAELAGKQGRFIDAAELLLKEEDLERAAEMFEKGGATKKAALLRGELAFHGGNLEEAADRFLEGGDNLRAAELYETSGKLEQAARCYEDNDAPLQAAGVYLRAGESLKAAAMYERGREFEQAAKLFEQAGDAAKASELYGQSGLYFHAGRLAHEQGDPDRAIQLLQQVESDNEHYETANLTLARLFLKKDLPGLAQDKLERLIGNQQITQGTLEHHYCLGLAYEQLGRTQDAADTYRKVMTERYGYEDVEARIERLSAARPASAPAPNVPSPAPNVPLPTPSLQPPPVAASLAPQSSQTSTPAAVAERVATAVDEPVATPAGEPVARPATAPTPASRAPAASPIQVGERLGEGLLGTTFKGLDSRNQAAVAVKVLRPELIQDPHIMQQFVAEAKLARTLEHPSLIRLLGLTEVNGQKAAVTEFVDGFSLDKFVKRNKRITVKQAVSILGRLAGAVAHGHQHRLLHRDLKLSNIFIDSNGMLKLAGFGFGALLSASVGNANGFPAPELIAGQGIGPRSDIYSLGALIFSALTEVTPEDTRITATGTTPSLQSLVPEAPKQLEDLLARCLTQQPEGRFASAIEVAQAAQAIAV